MRVLVASTKYTHYTNYTATSKIALLLGKSHLTDDDMTMAKQCYYNYKECVYYMFVSCFLFVLLLAMYK